MKEEDLDINYDPNDYVNALSKRELFAAMALQGILSRISGVKRSDVLTAIEAADLLIESLKENNEG